MGREAVMLLSEDEELRAVKDRFLSERSRFLPALAGSPGTT